MSPFTGNWTEFDSSVPILMQDAVIAVDASYIVTYLNDAACALYGRDRADGLGMSLQAFCCHRWLSADHQDEALAQVAKHGTWQGVNEHTRADGTTFLAETRVTEMRDKSGSRIGLLGIVRDISPRRDAEQLHRLTTDLRNRVAEFETLFNVVPVGIHVAEDPDCRVIRANPAGARIMETPLNVNLSKSAPPTEQPTGFKIFKNCIELRADQLPIQTTVATGKDVIQEELYIEFASGQSRIVMVNASPLFDDTGSVRGGIAALNDITALRTAEQALAVSEERYRAIIACLEEGIVVRDRNGNVIASNAAAERILTVPAASLSDSTIYSQNWHAIRDDGSTIPFNELPSQRTLETGMAQRDVTLGIVAPASPTVWISMNVQPLRHNVTGETMGVVASFVDVTERRQALTMLRDSEERLRLAIDGASIGTWHWDISEDRIVCSDTMKNLRGLTGQGVLTFDQFLHHLHEMDQPLKQAAVNEALATGDDYSLDLRIVMPDGAIRWLTEHGRPYYDDHGRPLRMEGVAWEITEAKIAEEAIKSQALRDSAGNKVSEAIRGSSDPNRIQGDVVNALGETLGLDRCFFATFDRPLDLLTISQDVATNELPSVSGSYKASEFRFLFEELFSRGTAVIYDLAASTLSGMASEKFATCGLYAVLGVPFFDNGMIVGALMCGMCQPRDWTYDEVLIVENAATMTRTAIEAALLQQKEHTIAQQLQAALQPAVPHHVPGLDLAHYYRAALDEAGVGGDFSDVFSVGENITYLVVGDLAGKGLAAASQVATVRNMLRFALYSEATLAEAVTKLNHTLSAHGLLSGFATLFVGRFDRALKTLSYVNCGQDPALVFRENQVLAHSLPPTGTVLGIVAHAQYDERSVNLQEGDVVVIYTDGFSEAGPTRSELLQMEGITRIVVGMASVKSPQSVVSQLVAGVTEHTRGGALDDQCLLVGIVSA
ncbi:MAG TPA: PAS domain S-box protein [Capsulimonadaceae bacterium]|jgi:PAS domain S-box-containing protein